MEKSHRLEILAGAAGVVTLGAVATGGVMRGLTSRRRADPYPNEDFDLIRADRSSVVVADDGVPLAVREVGPPNAPLTVLFSHGYCLDMRTWHFQRTLLRKRWGDDVRMVFFDQRGHGLSGTPDPASCSVNQLGADLAAVIRAVGGSSPVVLVGHSVGAMAIMALAGSKPELLSDKVIGAALIASAATDITRTGLGRGLVNPLVDVFRRAATGMPGAVQTGRGLAAVFTAPLLIAGGFGTEFRWKSVTRFVTRMLDATDIGTVAAFVISLEHHDERRGLGELRTVPTMVCCGYEDKVTPLESSVEMQAALDDCHMVGVSGAGHMVPLEAPDVVSDAIARLVDRAWQKRKYGD